MQRNNNPQDFPQQNGSERLSKALEDLKNNLIRHGSELGQRIKDTVSHELANLVESIDQQLANGINQMANASINQISEFSRQAEARLQGEISNLSNGAQSQIENLGNLAMEQIRNPAEVNIGDDNDTLNGKFTKLIMNEKKMINNNLNR